jgi:CTP:molybdopterin cytidylyltransferase MocA
MGRPKLALRLGGRTVLEHIITVLGHSFVSHAIVIFGPETRKFRHLVCAPAESIALPFQTGDMRETICAAMDHVAGTYRPKNCDAVLLAPVDNPTIEVSLVNALVAAHWGDPKWIRVPVFLGRRGHPTLFPWRLMKAVRNLGEGLGINVLLQRFAASVAELPTESAACHFDLDTAEDFRRLQRGWRNRR